MSNKITFVVVKANEPSNNALDRLHASAFEIISKEQRKNDQADKKTA